MIIVLMGVFSALFPHYSMAQTPASEFKTKNEFIAVDPNMIDLFGPYQKLVKQLKQTACTREKDQVAFNKPNFCTFDGFCAWAKTRTTKTASYHGKDGDMEFGSRGNFLLKVMMQMMGPKMQSQLTEQFIALESRARITASTAERLKIETAMQRVSAEYRSIKAVTESKSKKEMQSALLALAKKLGFEVTQADLDTVEPQSDAKARVAKTNLAFTNAKQ